MGRSDIALAGAIAALILAFSLARQVLDQALGSWALSTLAAGVVVFAAAVPVVRWARAA